MENSFEVIWNNASPKWYPNETSLCHSRLNENWQTFHLWLSPKPFNDKSFSEKISFSVCEFSFLKLKLSKTIGKAVYRLNQFHIFSVHLRFSKKKEEVFQHEMSLKMGQNEWMLILEKPSYLNSYRRLLCNQSNQTKP